MILTKSSEKILSAIEQISFTSKDSYGLFFKSSNIQLIYLGLQRTENKMCRSFWGKLFRNINNPYILCSNDPKSDEIRPVIRFMSPSCEVYQHLELVVAAEGELGVSCNQNMLFGEARTRLLPQQKISLNKKMENYV